mmetsp:Transcript_1516/g.2065  ORF Transcript_1516/g.2065 Transcript_1516/m.2065 type:complete len:242 (-) Transcript_1516:447-1172(-)
MEMSKRDFDEECGGYNFTTGLYSVTGFLNGERDNERPKKASKKRQRWSMSSVLLFTLCLVQPAACTTTTATVSMMSSTSSSSSSRVNGKHRIIIRPRPSPVSVVVDHAQVRQADPVPHLRPRPAPRLTENAEQEDASIIYFYDSTTKAGEPPFSGIPSVVFDQHGSPIPLVQLNDGETEIFLEKPEVVPLPPLPHHNVTHAKGPKTNYNAKSSHSTKSKKVKTLLFIYLQTQLGYLFQFLH